MKIALVHDYLREFGGAERVVEVLHKMYPEAPLYTAFVDWEALGEFAGKFKGWDIRTSWVDRNWLVKKYHSPLRFLTPLIWESFDLRSFDVVISSSGWYICRGVITHPHQIHISYIHHPPRNLYGYPTGAAAQSPWARCYGALINPFLRMYDFTTTQRVDYLITNSETTRSRIKKFYRREAEVIYPPVIIKNLEFRIKNEDKKGFYLSVGRLTYAKRVDLAIQACNELKLPLKVVGTGREESYLRSLAGSSTEFLGSVSEEKLSQLYRGAQAVIFCALEEDFGLVPVEAMSYGVPVVALRQGGVTETVVEGETGVFFDEPTVVSLKEAIGKLSKNYKNYKAGNIYKHASQFSEVAFRKKMRDFVATSWQKLQSGDKLTAGG